MVNISSDDSEDFDVETMRKELSASDPSDRAMRVKKPVNTLFRMRTTLKWKGRVLI